MKLALTLLIMTATAFTSFAADVPTRWLEGTRGFEQALKIQKETSLPILIWATWHECPNCAGVTKFINQSKTRSALKDSIKVVIDEHGPQDEAELAKTLGLQGGNFYVLTSASQKPGKGIWAWQPGDANPRIILDDLQEKLVAAVGTTKFP